MGQRSGSKGPFVDAKLVEAVKRRREEEEKSGKKVVIKTWSRRTTIIPLFEGVTFFVYNGRKFIPVTVDKSMIGHKLGEFAQTRIASKGRTVNKKIKL